ncbi:predicted protein [Coccidioides posadasii str. Silveira]|uniref:Predicted protein n=1 Tax=Coccidioides posadasii (strain RMSCC 757 / Silveira) TaxID=443226 RepID=E9D1I0_COCPS|nr:predicted protein [Coccidioides posadasii str. Silveira]
MKEDCATTSSDAAIHTVRNQPRRGSQSSRSLGMLYGLKVAVRPGKTTHSGPGIGLSGGTQSVAAESWVDEWILLREVRLSVRAATSMQCYVVELHGPLASFVDGPDIKLFRFVVKAQVLNIDKLECRWLFFAIFLEAPLSVNGARVLSDFLEAFEV